MMDIAFIVDSVVDTVYRNAVLDDFAGREGEYVEAPAGEVFAGYTYDGETFTAPDPAPAVIPDRVSARQFKMQLSIAGLKSQVETWVAGQDELAQIAYDNSGEFVRSEPMMQAGFAALEFTTEQIDAFFLAASEL